MINETLYKAIGLNKELNRIGKIIDQIEVKLETGKGVDNWDFDNVIISSIPMGKVQVPEHLAEDFLKKILDHYQKNWNVLANKLNDL